MARRATAVLASGEPLLLCDVVLAECVYVLSSVYDVPRAQVAALMRAAIGHASIETVDTQVLLRALTIYERERLGFADAYLAAQAEGTGVGQVLSFDRGLDRVGTITRREP